MQGYFLRTNCKKWTVITRLAFKYAWLLRDGTCTVGNMPAGDENMPVGMKSENMPAQSADAEGSRARA
jgi:hypothetical protein